MVESAKSGANSKMGLPRWKSWNIQHF
jgi:hypothetical protein